MDKYGMIESVEEANGNALNLAPKEAETNTSDAKDSPNGNLWEIEKATKSAGNLASSLSPNAGDATQDNTKPVSPKSTAIDKLKSAMMRGANEAMREFNAPTSSALPKLDVKPKDSTMQPLMESAPPAAIQPPKESQPKYKIETRKGGVNGWNRDGVFVELPQGIDINDNKAVEDAIDFDNEIIDWMNEEEN